MFWAKILLKVIALLRRFNKTRLNFKLLNNIKNNGAAPIVHKGGKQPVYKARPVQPGKLAALRKAVLIYLAHGAL